MMSNSLLLLVSAASGSLFFGFIGAVAATGTSVLLPGLGLVVAGPLVGGFIGAVFGSVLGLIAAAIIILMRRKTYP
jgi:uncharacterized membrane protein